MIRLKELFLIAVFSSCFLVTYSVEQQIAAVVALKEIGEYEEAEKTAENLLSIDLDVPEKLKILEILFPLYVQQKSYKKLIDSLQQAIAITTDVQEKNRYSIYIADAYYKMGLYSFAAENYRDCFLSQGKDELLFRYICALIKAGKLLEVEQLSEPFIFTYFETKLRAEWNISTVFSQKKQWSKVVYRLKDLIKKEEIKKSYFAEKVVYMYFYSLWRQGLNFTAQRELDEFLEGNDFKQNARFVSLFLLKLRFLLESRDFDRADSLITDVFYSNFRNHLKDAVKEKIFFTYKNGFWQETWSDLNKFFELFRDEQDMALLKAKLGVILGEKSLSSERIFKELEGKGEEISVRSRLEKASLYRKFNKFFEAKLIYNSLKKETLDEELQDYVLLQSIKCDLALPNRDLGPNSDYASNYLECIFKNTRRNLVMRLEAMMLLILWTQKNGQKLLISRQEYDQIVKSVSSNTYNERMTKIPLLYWQKKIDNYL